MDLGEIVREIEAPEPVDEASCTARADASLSESDLAELTSVIRVALVCADVCEATARIATRHSRPDIRLADASPAPLPDPRTVTNAPTPIRKERTW